MDVEQHHVGVCVHDARDRFRDRACVADHVDDVCHLCANAGAEQAVIVDEEDPDRHADARGTRKRTSVPPPIAVAIATSPPARPMRPSIESAIPRRSEATDARSKPAP